MDELAADRDKNWENLVALADGRNRDPFSLLGIHQDGTKRFVRTMQPQAGSVLLMDLAGNVIAPMRRIHDDGIFSSVMPQHKGIYRLRVESDDGNSTDIDDPYRYPSTLSETDLYLLGQGSHQRNYAALGAHCIELLGVKGVRFAVWAPNALRVSVVGDFNNWDGRRHVMRHHPGNGIWEIFLPDVGPGTYYKFELLDQQGKLLPLKSDPLAQLYEPPPGNAAIVYQSDYRWSDEAWIRERRSQQSIRQPVSIYEVHLGSWRRGADNQALGYRQIADELVAYVLEMGFTHVELLPITEHPFEGSWGYQPIGMYAPTQRFGNPDDFRYLVDRCHQSGISVIIDWVAAHFPRDEHGLSRFDGTALYEYEDPRKGAHPDWGTLIFNYGRNEVINYLIGSALYWIDEFHIDGLRVDAVASMLYLNYSKKDGEWLPNELGGNENLEAVAFLRRFNAEIHARGAESFAEESTTWNGVTHPISEGGLGFTYKWNMGWMNDTLKYMAEDPIHRKHHHDKMTFGIVYAFTEKFVLPLSHDEVVHGKRSLFGKIPGDAWQAFASLRAYYAAMYAYPGKKLLFMGNELAQIREWSHERALDWQLLDAPAHRGIQRLVQDLNRLYANSAPLYALDFEEEGFSWIDCENRDESIFSWLRRDTKGKFLLCVTNFTPMIRNDYRLGVPAAGAYRELINTDSKEYGGVNVGNMGKIETTDEAWHGQPHSLRLTLPPLATLMLQPTARGD